jgi:pyruvate dehydrogenase E1 component
VRAFRDRFKLPIDDEQLKDGAGAVLPPGEKSPEVEYMRSAAPRWAATCRSAAARPRSRWTVPPLATFERLLKSTGEREISTTMAFVQMLNIILRDKQVGPRCVPIVADEARTFGMEGLFRQLGIYAPQGQKYKPVDADQLMFYREDAAGQVLEEGITEAGAFASWMALATSYSTNDLQMLPFYIYYSMFGFQRVGDRLAGRRHARARLPARRHRRPHHAQRRRPAARGRPARSRPAASPTCAATTRPSATKW